MTRSLTNRQLSFLILLWIAACVLVVWWFEYRHWSTWQQQLALFSDEQIESLKPVVTEPSKITVMHLRSESCPCTVYQDAHIAQLQSTLKETHQLTLSGDQLNDLGLLVATPSVVIWDDQGKLVYFGPYSSGAVCGQGIGFVERTLQEIERGYPPDWLNTKGIGCFCQTSSDY
ncbi:hypothetical protein HF888_13240 [Bermanella marisrubri]|uniref:DUF6436 domain-containing protein n=1 Tax=Bermanella marisrubri TaxID=207949 RepID=Q1N334_9GAMM|nr:DUF6436 domain-containing protein [Bermanella marisrubri]EAT12757.1 hypothetical protein RED65_13772 [Oceanobacter sp. RED65] [Bermanella marisrubri]QIZ85127.1 hypothetical protein HF888_13240 [Bermanella marisrubri]